MKSRRKKIALLVPSSNTVMENDLHSALPKDRYTVHTDRMFLVETTREAESVMLEKYARPAASDVGTTNPDLIVFGCTSAGSELCGNLGDDDLLKAAYRGGCQACQNLPKGDAMGQVTKT